MNTRLYNLHFYGHITMDTVFLVNKLSDKNELNNCYDYYTAYGGIANCINWINRIDKDRKFNLSINNKSFYGSFEDHEEGSSPAVVIVEAGSGNKISFVKWNTSLHFEPVLSDWNHIMYVDALEKLDDLDIIKFKNKGMLSADMCLDCVNAFNANRILRLSQYFDYLFVSDNEMGSYAKDIRSCMRLFSKAGNVLMHHKNGCYYFNEDRKIEHLATEVIEGVNILGAGDMFAASFIMTKLLCPNISVKDNLRTSNKIILEFYREENKHG